MSLKKDDTRQPVGWAGVFAGLVLGVALGATSLLGGTLLLYSGEGLLGTTGLLLAVVLATLAAGVWAGSGGDRVPSTLWRWAGAVVVLAVGGFFAIARSRGMPSPLGTVGGGIGVLLLLAAPAYSIGNILAALHARRVAARAANGLLAAATLLGGAGGVTLAATMLVPRAAAGSVYFMAAAALTIASYWVGRAEMRGDIGSGAMRGKVVLVTGVGDRGQVGYALAEAFLREGARVLITARTTDALTTVVEELASHGDVLAQPADLTAEEDVARLADSLRTRFGRLDVLVNAAGGLTLIKPLAETSAEEWEREIQRNAGTAFLISRTVLPMLRETRGAIVNFASPAGMRAAANLGAYSAAKAGVVALTRALALEEKEHGVRVNAIAPGMINTEANRASAENPDSVKWVTREQIAAVVLFLASDAGAGISGETIQVAGEGLI